MASNITQITGRVADVKKYARSAYGNERWQLAIEPSLGASVTWYKTGPDARFDVDPMRLFNKRVTVTIKGAKSRWIETIKVEEV